MSGSPQSPEPARLEELAAVTREYARYSSSRIGVAGAVVGSWYVAVFWMASTSGTAASSAASPR